MNLETELDSPYTHAKRAQELERNCDYRGAEEEFLAAMEAADSLPLQEYKLHFDSKQAHEYAVKHAAATFGREKLVDSLNDLDLAYQQILALPFLTRLEMAGFYARHGAVEEAREVCEEALMIGIDEVSASNRSIVASYNRTKDLLESLNNIVGPPNAEEIFNRNFDKLDVDKNGFVHETELKRAQLDVSLDLECQQLIRYLLYHYFAVEKANSDELGIDISGISRKDVNKFQRKSKSTWKRMKNGRPS